VKNLSHIFDELHLKMVRTIAEGGMGIVYEAYQLGAGNFKKRIAVKLIREEYSKIKEFRRNFVGEARLVANLIHSNIVQTYHLGEMSGQYFMTMEYVDGITLEDFILRHSQTSQPVPTDLAAFIISRLCRGLNHAHQRCDEDGRNLGIVHRDVNPRNIMLSKEGDVKLTDFGIAKALDLMFNEEGEVIAGKDAYLSPEQALREVTDARADIFSCGIVLSEMLLGKNIFEAEDEEHTRSNILKSNIPVFAAKRSEIDPDLEQILQQSLTRDRGKRYQSSLEMLNDLELSLYGSGYGPTNEKLAAYIDYLFGPEGASAAVRWNATKGQSQKAADSSGMAGHPES